MMFQEHFRNGRVESMEKFKQRNSAGVSLEYWGSSLALVFVFKTSIPGFFFFQIAFNSSYTLYVVMQNIYFLTGAQRDSQTKSEFRNDNILAASLVNLINS